MVKNLEELLISWKFPKNVIEKYKSLQIIDIFDWQSECLQIDEVLGTLSNKKHLNEYWDRCFVFISTNLKKKPAKTFYSLRPHQQAKH